MSHEWILRFIQHRVADKRILRLIQKWLKAGVLKEGRWEETETGTPQGSVISPLLANVYLHYVFDLWVEAWRRKVARGQVTVVRYADDLVMGFQYQADAERFLNEVRERLAKFDLELHPDKTRLLEFGRFAAETRCRRGEKKPETFTFLGFVHYCGKSPRGRFVIWRQTANELSRTEEDMVQEQVRAGNQVRELLRRYYPQMLALCPEVAESWFWDLLELAPRPELVRKLTRSKVERILKQHSIRRVTAEQILAALQVPPLQLAPGSGEAASEHVLLKLPHLRLLHQQRKDVARRIQQILDEMSQPGQNGQHRDAAILLSLPGVGRIVAATMLAEASQPLADRDYHALRSYSGSAPITRQSGKKKLVIMRRSCNERMRNALYHWARCSMQKDDRSREHYAQLRKAGPQTWTRPARCGRSAAANADCHVKGRHAL
jgi:transposase